MSSDTITPFCLIDGDSILMSFPVKLLVDDTVGGLKSAIASMDLDTLKGIEAYNLVLWRAAIPPVDENTYNETFIVLNHLDDKSLLKFPRTSLSRLSLDDNTYIIIERPPDSKKRRYQDDVEIPHRKRFKANSTVYLGLRSLVYYADQTESNAPLIEKIRLGKFVRVYGARASGKSSRIIDAMEALKSNFKCIYIDLQSMNASSANEFWMFVCERFQSLGCPLEFKDANGFRLAFATASQRWTRPVIIFFDEFDVLCNDNAIDACSSMLSVLRDIRNEPSIGTTEPAHVIHSVVSIGTYAILQLNQTNPGLLPFNASDNFQNTGLSMDQVGELYRQFAKDRRRDIEDGVIEEIFTQSNGHAGLVNICGAALEEI